jgi:hypothetical protein
MGRATACARSARAMGLHLFNGESSKMKRLAWWVRVLGSVVVLAACTSAAEDEDTKQASDELSGYPTSDGGTTDSGGDGGTDSGTDSGTDGGTTSLNLRKSFAVTDQDVLAGFSFERVMNQITQSAATTTTSQGLYTQWWDTQRLAANGLTSGPHCDDQNVNGVPSHNGFAWQCPRNEGELASTNPFQPGAPGFVFPIGLFNRLDLAPTNGANCGEYRIVYGNTISRNLIIFEAVLPNPNPSCGINACRPVAQLWANLSSSGVTAAQARASLEQLYFTGVSGFQPVVHWTHYGAVGGQIRSNQFMFGQNQTLWNLKEFKLARTCDAQGVCRLDAMPVTVKTNPATQLFSDNTDDPRKTEFQNHFLGQVPSLAQNTLTGFGMSIPDNFNSGQSQSQSFDGNITSPTLTNNYGQVFNPTGPFATAIQQRLTQMGSPLTPRDIVERATTQSCGGCHNFSSNRSLGGGLTWPSSAFFVHVQESGSEPGGWGPGFPISDALKNVFLPHRRTAMQSFLARAGTCTTTKTDGGTFQTAPTSSTMTATTISAETLGGTRSVH